MLFYLIAVWESDRLIIKKASKPVLKAARELTYLRDSGKPFHKEAPL